MVWTNSRNICNRQKQPKLWWFANGAETRNMDKEAKKIGLVQHSHYIRTILEALKVSWSCRLVNLQMSSKKKKRSCPFSSSKPRKKKGSRTAVGTQKTNQTNNRQICAFLDNISFTGNKLKTKTDAKSATAENSLQNTSDYILQKKVNRSRTCR